MMGGTWLCNVSLFSPIFALITVFLESLGSLHICAILGSILSVGCPKKEWCLRFGNSSLPLVIGLVLFFSNPDGLFVRSCSMATLFQTTKMRMPHVAPGRGGVLLCW